MEVKGALKSLSGIRWIAGTIKPFLPALIAIVLVETLTSLSGVAIAVVSKNIIDLATRKQLDKAAVYTGLFAAIILFDLAANGFLTVFAARTYELYSNRLRRRIFSKLINMEWLQVSRYHSGDLLTRMTSDISSVANGGVKIPSQIIALGVQLIAAFVTLMIYEPGIAILAFLLAPFSLLISRLFGKKIKRLHLNMQEAESGYRSRMQEYIQNLQILKTFNLEHQSLSAVEKLQRERLHWTTERSKTGVMANTAMAVGYWAGYFFAFVRGAFKLADNTATFGTVTAFIQLVSQVQSPFFGLSKTFPQMIAAVASAGRLIELEELNIEEKGELTQIPLSAGIYLKNVSFNYKYEEKVLDSVTMEAQPGETVALTGMSGEGKTTIIRLLLALLKPGTGEAVCFDENGSEYKISSSTRNWFSYVPQGNTLFSGNIADNLRSGNPNAAEDELKAALGVACALDFVEKLPEGINTQIGEKAYGLSEGQAQRIAIARAVLRQAPVIILDEATSALDIEQEAKVIEGIRNLRPVRTCIMITHRKTSLNICSRIYRLKDGRLTLEKAAA